MRELFGKCGVCFGCMQFCALGTSVSAWKFCNRSFCSSELSLWLGNFSECLGSKDALNLKDLLVLWIFLLVEAVFQRFQTAEQNFIATFLLSKFYVLISFRSRLWLSSALRLFFLFLFDYMKNRNTPYSSSYCQMAITRNNLRVYAYWSLNQVAKSFLCMHACTPCIILLYLKLKKNILDCGLGFFLDAAVCASCQKYVFEFFF